ncbi:SubName: Full=Uncharacterized protein {ECO:0000313/EMBL:CCA75239.1} [Serendipita indica DSM 11827]|nr:SubName: Full=Uncharacterized protein {ECO:0000313/EMBL:CCA75239.1} [Serendipita indica DSM 11827]
MPRLELNDNVEKALDSDAGIPATRVVSGRRFIRWDALPDLLASAHKQIIGLPFDFFTWASSGLSGSATTSWTPSATPQHLIAVLHAAPLNINILSWKKSTIEHLLDLLKTRQIRVDDATDDTVFTITLPDGGLFRVPSWPPIDISKPSVAERSIAPSVGIRRRNSKRTGMEEFETEDNTIRPNDPPSGDERSLGESTRPGSEVDRPAVGHTISEDTHMHSRRSSASGMVSGLKRPRSADAGLSDNDEPRKSVASIPTYPADPQRGPSTGPGAKQGHTGHVRGHSIEVPSWIKGQHESIPAHSGISAPTSTISSITPGTIPTSYTPPAPNLSISTLPTTSGTSASASAKPAQAKKWTRRSSPDRVFMNTELNSLLRRAGMGIPRQKDDASRLPWSSIPQFLAERGLYLTNWPEANLPWLYSGDQGVRPSTSGAQPGIAGYGEGDPVEGGNRIEWRDRIDWKSSPSQRSYKALAAALRTGEIQILPRPPGRDVLFEVKDPQGRKYDSTLGLSNAWKLRWMRDPVPGTVGTSVTGASTSSVPSTLETDAPVQVQQERERGRPGYARHHTRSRSHSPHFSTALRGAGTGIISASRSIRGIPGHTRHSSGGLPPPGSPLNLPLPGGAMPLTGSPSALSIPSKSAPIQHRGDSFQRTESASSSPTSYRPPSSFAFPPLSSSHAPFSSLSSAQFGPSSPLQPGFTASSSLRPSSHPVLPSQPLRGSSYPPVPGLPSALSTPSSNKNPQRDHFSTSGRASSSTSRRTYSPGPEGSPSRLRHHPYDRAPSPMLLGRTSSTYSLPSLLNAGSAGPTSGKSNPLRLDPSPGRSSTRMDVDPNEEAPFQRTLPPILRGAPFTEERGSSYAYPLSEERRVESSRSQAETGEPALMHYDGATVMRRRRPSTAPSYPSISAPQPILGRDDYHRRVDSSTFTPLSPTGFSSSSGSLLHAAPSSITYDSPTPQSSSPASSAIPTHLPHPTAAFSQPIWDARGKTWTLSVIDPERAALPPLGDEVVWDVQRGVWRLRWMASVGMNTISSLTMASLTSAPGGSSSSEEGSSQRTLGVADSPIAVWNVEQDAWILIP